MRYVLAVALILAAAVGLAWHRSSAIQEDLAGGVEAALVAAADDPETPLVAGTGELGGNGTLEAGAAAAPDVAEAASGTTEATGEVVLWEDCQARLDTVLATGSIDFESSSAELSPASLPLLDELVAVLLRCGEAQVEFAGHTDASGSREENLDLSMVRAEAVMTYLLAHNVTVGQLSAIGYGPDRRLVDNATPEGRARNRRIELEVLNP